MEQILDFYKNSILYERLTTLSYEKRGSTKRYFFDYLPLNSIEIKESKIILKINKQLQMFLLNQTGKNKGISPINYMKNKEIIGEERAELLDIIEQELFESGEKKGSKEYEYKKLLLEVEKGIKIEKNNLIFSPVYIKVNFIEEESEVFIPIITFNITQYKELIDRHSYANGELILTIDMNQDIEFLYNNFATDIFMKDTFKEIQNSILYIANSDSIDSTAEVFEKIYENIETHLEENINNETFTISFPKFKRNGEPVGLFFNQENTIEIDKDFIKLKKSKSKVLEEYLTTKTDKNHTYELSDEIYYGSMTDKFPLAKGQAIVMQKNQENQQLTSVIGPPGTGKTTLFLSIIANNVVKRALSNIIDKKDYNNLMIITSTSNKAVENVYTSLKERYRLGFCYVGGNYENKKVSGEEVREYVSYLKDNEYREGSMEEIELQIMKIHTSMQAAQKRYLSTRKILAEEYGITSIQHLDFLKIKRNSITSEKELLEEITEIVTELNTIADKNLTIEDYMEYIQTKDSEYVIKTAKSLGNLNVVLDMIGYHKHILKKAEEKKCKFYTGTKENYINMGSLLITLKKYKKDITVSLERINEDNKKRDLLDMDQDYMKSILQNETFGEFFSKVYYKVNFKLFKLSKRYLEQKAIKNKFSSIEALETLVSGDMYSVRDPQGFLENISLMYPVVTSTLAGFKYMFRNLNQEIIYESVLADEAGMIKVQDLLTPLSRSKRGIIVGDPKQLPPIVTMHTLFNKYLKNKTNDDELFAMFSPTEVSGYHRAAGTQNGRHSSTGYGVMLNEHRRCQKEIADMFIKVAEYDGIDICTEKTNINNIKPFVSRKVFFNTIDRDKKDRHINIKEIETIREIINIMDKSENFNIKEDLAIITPYKKQESELIAAFGDKIGHSKETKKIGTIHKFQGVEFKVMIFSTVVSSEEDSLMFINKDPSMVNVSISRAKELFIVVGDYEKLSGKETGNYIGRMTGLMKDNQSSIDSLNF